jgi:3-oxoacyl-[acyl-carrier protein] reductase
MDPSLQGKTALVTGSSRGIGAAIAEALAEQGATIIVNYVHSEERARQWAEYISGKYNVEALALQADVTDEKAVANMIGKVADEFGGMDIVVNNALRAYSFDPERRKLAWEMDWSDYEHQLDGALKGAFHVCKYAVPLMKANGFGRIINMVSDLIFRPVVPYHDYNTAKGALLSFSQNLAVDLGPFGITVNCVAPGLVYPTDASRSTKEEVKEAIIAETPLRRIARPDDVAGCVLFFASEWSRFVTGQCLVVDGGLVMR